MARSFLALVILVLSIEQTSLSNRPMGSGIRPELPTPTLESDPCQDAPCLNGGRCSSPGSNDALLTCDCRSGFIGNRCQFRDPCILQPRRCSNGGTCRAAFPAVNRTTSSDSVEPTFECLCKRGYLGPNCTTVDFCAAYPCDCQGHSNSVCGNLENGYACECRKGYRGIWCNIDIDECTLEEPCANGGTCINTIGSFRCICRNGFKGAKCTEVHVPCAENPCQNGGRCHPGSSVNFPDFCECASGFSGNHCEVNVDDCVDNACQNGGICQDQVNGYTCDCQRPYGGKYCNEEIGYE